MCDTALIGNFQRTLFRSRHAMTERTYLGTAEIGAPARSLSCPPDWSNDDPEACNAITAANS
ncbi:MAG: hypothetical protein LW806_11370 [Planctomycetaceae bacterium]|nr:hypothetical protein [Planctomycetaceae bacterium]